MGSLGLVAGSLLTVLHIRLFAGSLLQIHIQLVVLLELQIHIQLVVLLELHMRLAVLRNYLAAGNLPGLVDTEVVDCYFLDTFYVEKEKKRIVLPSVKAWIQKEPTVRI